MANSISNLSDIIDIRDVIERFEEIESEFAGTTMPEAEAAEHKMLLALLAACKGNGGDEEWDGNWYPIALIRASYFQDYAQEFADDCGLIDNKATWPYTCIDWEQAARELKMDYTPIEFDGVTYFCR